MLSNTTYSNKLLKVAKLVLLFSIFGFVFYKLLYAYDLDQLIKNYDWQFTTLNAVLLTTATILMPINWLLETLKWQTLLNLQERTSFADALKAVVSGTCLSIITPNHIGDFAGRIIHLKELSKVKGVLLLMLGDAAQMFMTLFFGITGVLIIAVNLGWFEQQTVVLLYAILVVLALVMLFIFYKTRNISRLPWPLKVKQYLSVFDHYNNAIISRVFVYALLRYITYTTQYLLMLNVFNIPIDMTLALACIATSLLAQSIVPSFLLIQIGMRGATALWLFGKFVHESQLSGVLLATYSLWIINLLLPALVGMFILLKWRSNSDGAHA